jgi:hypothetical protein
MQHVIKKQVIELNLKKNRDAFRMQHLISEHYRNEIVHLLENVFDNYCGEDDVLLLDKLEIDFGIISEADLEKGKWDESILANFKTNLIEQFENVLKSKITVKRSKSSNICKQWIFYMQHGYLSWNTLKVDEQWYNVVLEMLATDYSSVTTLRGLITQDEKIAYRIVWQHDVVFLTKLVEILTAQNQKLLPTAIEEICSVLKLVSPPIYKDLTTAVAIKILWQQAIVIVATEQKNASAEDITTILLRAYEGELLVQKRQQHLLASVSTIKKPLSILLDKKAIQNSGKSLSAEELKAATSKERDNSKQTKDEQIPKATTTTNTENKEYPSEKDREEPTSTRDKRKDVAPGKTEGSNKTAKREIESSEDNQKKRSDTDAKEVPKQDLKRTDTTDEDKHSSPAKANPTENRLFKQQEKDYNTILHPTPLRDIIPHEGVFILNAGIVLTHPFLSALFVRLQWIEDNYFVSADMHLKAVFMLHYLATGSTTAEEYQLLLCKLMCAYPIDESLPAEMIFTEAELTEANDMLTAMIQQWNKLQNTSIAGLREGFLQRSGKLFVKNDATYVQVETHGIDILLDYLPWSLSIIKLPWMKEILRVEWR